MDLDMCTMELMNDRLTKLLHSFRVNFSTVEVVRTADALCAAYRSSSDGEHCWLGVFSSEEQLFDLVDLHVTKRMDSLTDVVRDHLKARGVAYSRAIVTRHMPTTPGAPGGYGLVVEVGDSRDLVASWYFLPSNMQAIWALRDWRAPGAAAQSAATAPAPKVELGQVWLHMPSQRLFTVVDQPEPATWDLSDGSDHLLETEQHMLTSPDWQLPAPQRRCLVRNGQVLTPERRAEIVQEELAHPPDGATAEAWRLVVLETAEPSDDHQVAHSRALIRALGYARIGIERYERARQRLLRYGK